MSDTKIGRAIPLGRRLSAQGLALSIWRSTVFQVCQRCTASILPWEWFTRGARNRPVCYGCRPWRIDGPKALVTKWKR